MKHSDEGFTIIETLTALAILAVALVLLYGAGATSLRSSAHIANVDRAILLAQSKLDEIAATRTPLPVKSEGDFSDSNIRWEMVAEVIPESKLVRRNIVLQNVNLDLLWRDGFREQSFALETRHLGVEP